MQCNYAELLQAARTVSMQAADILREMHTRPRTIQQKGRIDIVTETDLAVEAFLRDALAPLVPGAAFLGEESAANLDIPEYCWVVDPVDGTTNYAHGLPVVGISIAFCIQGDPVVGIVEIPLMNESWYAARGQGAFLNGKPIHVSKTDEMEKSLLATGFPYNVTEDIDLVMARLRSALLSVQGVRRCGAAAVDLVWLAGGRFDIFYEAGLKPWDMAAGWCIVREAGGTVSCLDGTRFTLNQDTVLASNGLLHDEALALLRLDP